MSKNDDGDHADAVVASSASGTTFLIMIQVASRGFTFAANQLVLRRLSPATLGIATQLELLSTSILFFSRESVRIAIQRQPIKSASRENDPKAPDGNIQSVETQTVVNISYLSILLGIPLSLAMGELYAHFAAEEVSRRPYFLTSVAITALSACLELCAEPFFAVVQQRMLYRTRAVAETSAAFVKSVMICIAYIWAANMGFDVGVLPYALGFLGYSFALVGVYAVSMTGTRQKNSYSIFLSRIFPSNSVNFVVARFSRPLLLVAASVFFQSIVKHVLTQGDAMMLAAMSSLEDQGTYSLASNYGGLIARIVFQPIEESSRNLFSTLLANTTAKNTGESTKATKGNTNTTNNDISIAKPHLLDILRFYGLLSVLIFPLGPTFVPLLLRLLAGRQWTSPQVTRLLASYCLYIPFLAFNGITEAFVSAAATPAELRNQTGWMGIFSACFALAAYLFLKIGDFGAEGLVWANIVNMLVRIIWSWAFIRRYFGQRDKGRGIQGGHGFGEAGLHKTTYALCALVFSILVIRDRDELAMRSDLASLSYKLALGIGYVFVVIYLERDYVTKIYVRVCDMIRARALSGTKPE